MSTAGPSATRDRDASPTVHYVDLLWDAVLRGDEYAAVDITVDALRDGLDVESILLDVIGGVQARVGAEWAADRITVAQEHAATAINDRVIGTLTLARDRPRPHLGRVTVACVDGEWHALPARLLAEVLTMRGFAVDYLGAQVPTPHLITHLHRTGPDAVALSSSIATRLPAAHATISACQAAGVPVIVGGAAFGPDGRYAELLCADAWAPDARSAADRLAAGPLPAPQRPHAQPFDDLPHLSDQEYTLVTRSATRLVAAVLDGLDGHGPARTPAEREQTAEDVRGVVDFLATALYTGDDDLFVSFLHWTADIRAARGVPATTLHPALELLAVELRDFDRASGMLRTALAGTAPGDRLPRPGRSA